LIYDAGEPPSYFVHPTTSSDKIRLATAAL
jgi:hypothetical protein